MTIDLKELGAAIKRCRKIRGVTQGQLAEAIKRTLNYVSLLETGKRGATIETLNAIGEALSVPAELLTFVGSHPHKNLTPNLVKVMSTAKQLAIAAIESDQEFTTTA